MHRITPPKPRLRLLTQQGSILTVEEPWFIQALSYAFLRYELIEMRRTGRVVLHDYRRIEHDDGHAALLRCLDQAIAHLAMLRAQRLSKAPRPHPGSKRGTYGYFRAPGTQPERREHAAWALIGTLDGEPAPRPARRPAALPTAWDDQCRNLDRSWKRHRRTRWKPARR